MTNEELREHSPSVRALLCDLDGTLIDSAEDIRRALKDALALEGLRPLTVAKVNSLIGSGQSALMAGPLTLTGGPTRRQSVSLRAMSKPMPAARNERMVPFPTVVETLGRSRSATSSSLW